MIDYIIDGKIYSHGMPVELYEKILSKIIKAIDEEEYAWAIELIEDLCGRKY